MESGGEVIYTMYLTCPYLIEVVIKRWGNTYFKLLSVVCSSLPVARSAHGATVYSDKLWIFAGYDGNAR